jgi:rhamnulokinase
MSASRKTFLAVDLGASSGRVMAGHYDGSKIEIEEVSRFANGGVQLADGWHWDTDVLFSEIKKGLIKAGELFGAGVVSIAVDTWGVDYVLLDEKGEPLNLPWMYRDSRTDGMVEEAARTIGGDKIWERTGIQPLFFNTVYQLMAESKKSPHVLERANEILFIPDYLNYKLCGKRAVERSIASTSGLLFAGSPEWELEMASALDIPSMILTPVTEPCTVLGPLSESIAKETGLTNAKVATCGSHDTASAVAAVPSTSHPLFISSGTWSLLGIELRRPVLSHEARIAGFSNEQGLEGTTRFLTNISGMWLLQECRRVWMEAGQTIDYSQMVEMATKVEAPCFIDPDAPDFQKPCDMPATILEWIKKTGQPLPSSDAELVRVILESLALKYRSMVRRLAKLVPELPDTLHIVGGGCQNRLLNQMTSDATGLRVVTGPVEATAIGNVIAQMIAFGIIPSLSVGRELLQRSFDLDTYLPRNSSEWDAKAERFEQMIRM